VTIPRIAAARIAAACALSVCLVAPALARPARCVITSPGAAYRGKCDFTAMPGNGGFGVSPIGRTYFFNGIAPISVVKTSTNAAEVRGLTRDGINSRWGEAARSKRDPACWDGDDFKICVY
jgi:hypothetical protein